MILLEAQMDHPESRSVEFAKIVDILEQTWRPGAEEQSVIWVTTSDKHDKPHVVPLWYMLEDGTMYATCNPGSKICRNLNSNSHLTATTTHQAMRRFDPDTMIVITADATIGLDEGSTWKRKISGKYLPAGEAQMRGDRGVEKPEVLIAIPINPNTTEGFTFPKRK